MIKYELIKRITDRGIDYRIAPLSFLDIKGGKVWFADENGDTVYFFDLLNVVFDSEQDAQSWIDENASKRAA